MNNKNAIIILTRGYNKLEDYDLLIKRNKSLLKFYNSKIDYVVFHEGNIYVDHQNYISSFTPKLKLIFIDIGESFVKEDIPIKIEMKWGLGYRNMCNFWFTKFWKYVQKYERIIRIDEDCIFYSNYNHIFNLLEDKVSVFAKKSYDELFVIKGLNDFTINFLNNKNIKAKKRNVWGPYTNVIGLNLIKLRKNLLLKEYINSIKNSKNIFYYRWGDLPLWGEVLYYFYNEKDYLISDKIIYYHKSHDQFVNKSNKKKEKNLLMFLRSKKLS